MLPKLKSILPGLLLLQATSFVASCSKTDLDLNNQTPEVEKLMAAKKPAKTTVTIEPYHSVVFDSCRAENVVLDGQSEYKLIESFANGYYIYYEIKLEKVTGIGEITGTVYHGGGRIVGTRRVSADGLNQTAKVSYRVKYVGNNGNKITFFQSAKFVVRNGVTKIDFNDILDTCK